jgi:translation elongation factor EF-G
MKAIVWPDDTMGAEYRSRAKFPPTSKKKAEAFHAQLVETVAENDDDILHKFLEGEAISARKSCKRVAAQIDDRAEGVSGGGGNGVQE